MIWKTARLVFTVSICLAVGYVGSLTTRESVTGWYAGLAKPVFAPPGWVFGVVWTVLYVMMGAAAFVVWERGVRNREVRIGLELFVLQLVLNALWTPLFFRLHWVGTALVEMVVLWVVIGMTVRQFWRVRKAAGILLLPYLGWVGFAIALNGAIWYLNR